MRLGREKSGVRLAPFRVAMMRRATPDKRSGVIRLSAARMRSVQSQKSCARQQRAPGRVVLLDDARGATFHGLMIDIIRQFGTELLSHRGSGPMAPNRPN